MTDDEQEPKKLTEEGSEPEKASEEEQPPPLYRDKRTAQFASGERVKAFQDFEEQAKKRLLILHSAASRRDLMLLPSSHFEALGGDRKGQFSIRINLQWRLCFHWPDDYPTPFSIEIVDYH